MSQEIKADKLIILIGAMGSGKTSVGYELACLLKCDFYDTDNELVARSGISINDIFNVEGETSFRKRESAILTELCGRKHLVIASGGGIIIKARNRKLLKKCGFVIYLQSSIECLLKRTDKDDHRPLLNKSSDKKQTIIDLLKAREHWYLQCADIVIDTSDKPLHSVVNEIKKHLL